MKRFLWAILFLEVALLEMNCAYSIDNQGTNAPVDVQAQTAALDDVIVFKKGCQLKDKIEQDEAEETIFLSTGSGHKTPFFQPTVSRRSVNKIAVNSEKPFSRFVSKKIVKRKKIQFDELVAINMEKGSQLGEDIDFVDETEEKVPVGEMPQEEEEFIFVSEGTGRKAPFHQINESKRERSEVVYVPKRHLSSYVTKPSKPVALASCQPFQSEITVKKAEEASKEKIELQKTIPKGGMVFVAPKEGSDGAGFYIQSKKVTNIEFQEFIKAVGYKAPLHWDGGEIPSGSENDPVVNITYKDALLYSVWKGLRLPRERELLTAKIEGHLSDADSPINEWTSTTAVGIGRGERRAGDSVRMGETAGSAHVVFGWSSPKSMGNSEYNTKTGFRLAKSLN